MIIKQEKKKEKRKKKRDKRKKKKEKRKKKKEKRKKKKEKRKRTKEKGQNLIAHNLHLTYRLTRYFVFAVNCLLSVRQRIVTYREQTEYRYRWPHTKRTEKMLEKNERFENEGKS